MLSLGWKDFFKALVPAGLLGYLLVGVSGSIWVGIPALMGFSWLFHDFRKKITTFKRIFKEELLAGLKGIGLSGKAFGSLLKRKLWSECQIRIYSYSIVPITITTIFFMIFSALDVQLFYLVLIVVIFTPLYWIAWICFAGMPYEIADTETKLTDELIGRFLVGSCRFIFWQIWKFLFKVIILTIREVHSRESVVMAIYGLSGVLYILIFPPFQLAPAIQFLLGIGCGFFMSFCGLVMHKILSIVSVQAIFAKAETW